MRNNQKLGILVLACVVLFLGIYTIFQKSEKSFLNLFFTEQVLSEVTYEKLDSSKGGLTLTDSAKWQLINFSEKDIKVLDSLNLSQKDKIVESISELCREGGAGQKNQ